MGRRIHVSGWLEIDDEQDTGADPTVGTVEPGTAPDPTAGTLDPSTPAVDPTAGTLAGDPGTEQPSTELPASPVDAFPPVETTPEQPGTPVDAQPDGQPPIGSQAPAVDDPAATDPGATDPAASEPGAGDPPPSAVPAGPPFPGTVLTRDDHQHTPNPDVRAWQQAATDNGYDVGRVDGFFGPRTESGVIAAQQGAQLTPSGEIDEQSWSLAWTPATTA